jgi:hypothetical protein
MNERAADVTAGTITGEGVTLEAAFAAAIERFARNA